MQATMTLSSALLLLVSSINGIVAAPAPEVAYTTCTSENMLVRQEWRTLSNEDRLSYVNAVKCLMATPARTGDLYEGVTNRYDDFVALHINSTNYVHFNGPFLAWHRWLLHLWEADLRSLCGYTGAQPYWDFSLDNTISGFPNSPLFDEVYGFGGNGPYIANVSSFVQTPTAIPGRTGGGCVENGPFANLTANMGIGFSTTYTPHCLRRDFSPTLVSETLSDSVLEDALNSETFNELNLNIQGTSFEISGMKLHAGLHIGIGGQVGDQADMYSSPNDPLFYFIHAALDKVWDQWQRASWDTRKSDYSGPDTMFAYPFNFFGDIPYTNITLDYPLHYDNFGDDVKISDVMDTEASILCYKYI